jgi:hypothetical protein
MVQGTMCSDAKDAWRRLLELWVPRQVRMSNALGIATARYLSDSAVALPVPKAMEQVDDAPGLYSIFIDHPKSLPEPFASMLIHRDTHLLYVGRARDSLSARLIDQELRHKRAATFFRGIGAVLGFRPPCRSLRGKANRRNYRFSKSDTAQVVRWIDKHLLVRWLRMPVADLVEVEPTVIHNLRPLLNTTHNPDRCGALADLRELCRRVACR